MGAADTSTLHIGLIAQEVEPVFPDFIGETLGNDGSTYYKVIKYDRFAPIFIEAIKEQQVQIEALQNQEGIAIDLIQCITF